MPSDSRVMETCEVVGANRIPFDNYLLCLGKPHRTMDTDLSTWHGGGRGGAGNRILVSEVPPLPTRHLQISLRLKANSLLS